MKRLIVALLLFAFSLQGMGAGTGVNVLSASRSFAQAEAQHAQAGKPASSPKADPGLDDLKLLSIAEELSDYVLPELAPMNRAHSPPSAQIAGRIPSSTILPRHFPPPRS